MKVRQRYQSVRVSNEEDFMSKLFGVSQAKALKSNKDGRNGLLAIDENNATSYQSKGTFKQSLTRQIFEDEN